MPPQSSSISINLSTLGITGTVTITDVWTGKKIGEYSNVFSQNITQHGSGFYRLSKK